MASVQRAFRNVFKPVCKETLQWYPGHMEKSFAKMQNKIKQVDCVIEVHDARIPLSGRNPNFLHRLVGPKPHILVLNKKDLIDYKARQATIQQLKSVENIVFTNSKYQECRGIKQIVPKVIDLMRGVERYNRFEEKNLKLMVIGVPNVGKSSLINGLRNYNMHKGKASAVGAIAGVTRAVQNEVKINMNPPVYLVDTPGILPPNIADLDTGMKLALCSCLNDSVVGILQIADYLLFWLNKYQIFSYVEFFNLDEPCDSIAIVLIKIAKNENKFKKIKDMTDNKEKLVPNAEAAAYHFVTSFRQGKLGYFSLDFHELCKNCN